MVGSLTLLLTPEALERLLMPLVAFAAGSLIGGAFFHMIPASLGLADNALDTGAAVVAGFTAFLVLEHVLQWRHCHRARRVEQKPLGYLILIGDGLHNFLGGLAIGGTFLIDIRLGITSWLAAAAHEVPQEIGDFGVLISSGWSKRNALLFNALSALTFLAGGLLAYVLSFNRDVSWLIPFAAGNFIYIAATDLIPEINRLAVSRDNLVYLGAFVLGLLLLFAATLIAPC